MKSFNAKNSLIAFVVVLLGGVAFDIWLHNSVLWGLYILAGLMVGGVVGAVTGEDVDG